MGTEQPLQERERCKATLRLRPCVRYSVRWEPDIGGCTGESGTGLRAGLRVWWQVRRGLWRDDDLSFPDD